VNKWLQEMYLKYFPLGGLAADSRSASLSLQNVVAFVTEYPACMYTGFGRHWIRRRQLPVVWHTCRLTRHSLEALYSTAQFPAVLFYLFILYKYGSAGRITNFNYYFDHIIVLFWDNISAYWASLAGIYSNVSIKKFHLKFNL
jgi:hypothetical protein